MNSPKLAILPSLRLDNDSCSATADLEGFVDDEVVMALLTGPLPQRSAPRPEDLILSADDMDFAGWCLSPKLPARSTLPAEAPLPVDRRAAEPVLDEPGLGIPHSGNHRWWIAGLAGALSTLLISLLLISLSNRDQFDHEGFSIIRPPAKVAPSPAKGEKPAVDPQLTRVAPAR